MKRGGGDDHDHQGLGLLTPRWPLRIPGVARLLTLLADEFYDPPRPPGPLWPKPKNRELT